MNFIQGEATTFYISFIDIFGNPLIEGVSGTTIDIYHFSSSTLINDVSSGTMIQQSSPFENTWYYEYTIPTDANRTNYNVIYNALFSGETIQSSETFNVFPADTSFPIPEGLGNISVSGTVIDGSGVGIYNATVTASSGLTTYASVSTNASGNYNVYLNAGQYLFNFYANGYYPTQELNTIPSGTIWYLGNQVMQTASQGIITISDTFVYQTPNLQIIPLPNLKVSLYNKLDVAGTNPIGIAYTNANGTFIMNAPVATYVMTVQGEFWNVISNKNDRYNYSYNIEVNPIWSGTGTGGNSPPLNFQYLDSSKTNYL